MLSEKVRGGAPVPINAGTTVYFNSPASSDSRRSRAIRRKADMTIELADGTELRRDFKLPEEDVETLDALGLRWETVVDGGTKWLIRRTVGGSASEKVSDPGAAATPRSLTPSA